MLLIKGFDDYIAYVEYDCNSGWCTIVAINVVSKGKEIDCQKIAEKLLQKYKKDARLIYDDIEEFGNTLQKVQIRS